MSLFFPGKSNPVINENMEEWATVIPTRNCDFSKTTASTMVLHVPRSRNKILEKFLNFFASSPYIRIKLDERGSFIWQHCDGKTNIQQICNLLIQEFGDEVEPARERTVLFIRQLYKYKIIKLYRPETTEQNS